MRTYGGPILQVQHYNTIFCFLQTNFARLYKLGSSFQGGTLLQLRNLINHCNVSANTTGWFNETTDFFNLQLSAAPAEKWKEVILLKGLY